MVTSWPLLSALTAKCTPEAPDPTIRTLATIHRRLPLIGNQGRNQVEWAEHQEADEQGERETKSAPKDPQRENGRTAFACRIEPEVSRRAVFQHCERQDQLLPQHPGRAQNPGVTVGAAQQEPPGNRRAQQQAVNPFGRLLREIGNSSVAQAVLRENVGCGRKPGEISGEGSALICESLLIYQGLNRHGGSHGASRRSIASGE